MGRRLWVLFLLPIEALILVKYIRKNGGWDNRLDAAIECECGLTSTRSHFARHKRTQRHKERMATLEK